MNTLIKKTPITKNYQEIMGWNDMLVKIIIIRIQIIPFSQCYNILVAFPASLQHSCSAATKPRVSLSLYVYINLTWRNEREREKKQRNILFLDYRFISYPCITAQVNAVSQEREKQREWQNIYMYMYTYIYTCIEADRGKAMDAIFCIYKIYNNIHNFQLFICCTLLHF